MPGKEVVSEEKAITERHEEYAAPPSQPSAGVELSETSSLDCATTATLFRPPTAADPGSNY